MTAFLKIGECKVCHRAIPWEWAPAVLVDGKPLSGTGVWRSQLVDRQCPACVAAIEARRQAEQRALARQRALVELLGGEKPYREFTFERYEIKPGNQAAYERSKRFNSKRENLYLWGPCGVGKTHLAFAAARCHFKEISSVTILRSSHLSRKVRMKEPEQEQAAINELADTNLLVLDDLGAGPDTAYSRGILQEILDTRDFNDRAGLIATSKYSLDDLAAKLGDDAIPSRLAGLCTIVPMRGPDGRLTIRKGTDDVFPEDHGPALGVAQR